MDGYYIVKTEDFVYNPRISTSAPVGPINRNKLGRTGVMSPLYTVFRPHDIDTTYLEYFFKCGYWHSFMNFNGDSGARSDRFSIRDNVFFQMPIPIPDIDEQRKIGELLTCLDNLITLHQRQPFLQSPPDISLIVQLTPPFYTFSWEQRKFEEIAVRSSVICSDDTLPRVEYEDIVSGTGRLNKDIYAKQSSKSGIVFHQGDVLYGKLRPYLQNWLLPTFDGLAVGDFWVLQPQNADSSFLYRLIQSRQFDEVANQSTGTKMPRADWKLVSKTVFSIPSNISEQAAIGTYFTALDSLITLHQRKCIFFTGRAGRLISTVNKKRITSSWEQRKLGDMMNVTSVKRIHQSDWTDSGVRFLRARDIVAAAKNEEPDDYLYISKEKYEEYSTLSGKVGVSDLLVTGVGTIGVPYLVRNLEPLYFKDGNIIWFQNSDKIDGKFLFYSFSAEQIQGFINESAGIGTVGTYTIESGKKTPISLPNQIEQAKVGEFFQQLDNLITLHQRKCALLFSPFQAFISMMFITSTFSWEQREVGDLLIERSQQAPMSDEYPLMAFIANEGVAPKGERYDRSALVTDTVNKLYKKTEKGDFIYSSNNLETGSIGLNKYGKACISPVYSIFEPTGIADSDFLGRRLVRKDFINAMVKWRQGVIYGQWRIHESDFLKIEISVPSVEEQRKIGAYLDQLDNLITLHQRKFEKLTNVKKSMLEKMFPQNGSSYPEIRFKGFTDPWEQRKLASLCEKFTDGDWIESKDQSDFGVRLVQTGNVGVAEYLDKPNNKKWISEDTFDRLHCEEVLPGDILISRLPEPAGRACIVPLLGTKMITAVDCTIVRTAPDMSNKFLVQYLSSQAYFDDVNTCLAGGTRQRISRGNLANFNVPIPVKKSEQDAIGMFFGYLDNLITLHQRELEKLQNIKKSMLEKMFV